MVPLDTSLRGEPQWLLEARATLAETRAFLDQAGEILARLERNQQQINGLSFALDDLHAEVQELKGWTGAGYEGTA